MIPANNPLLYSAALVALSKHRQAAGRGFKGRFIQIFLGMKFYQNVVPSMFSGSFVSTEVLQTLLDDLYAKASRPPNDAVLVLFYNRYRARTGLVGVGNKGTQNTWRNNFNLQKGVVCYAPPSDLASQVFLDQSRSQCKYLVPQKAGRLAGAHCSLQPRGAMYRNEDHRKWLRIDTNGEGYAVVDLLNHQNFVPYVAPGGLRIPVLPIIVALYHDGDPGLVIGQRAQIDVDDFRTDFNLSLAEFSAYFDDDPAARGNAALLSRFRTVSYTRATSAPIVPRPVSRSVARPPRPATLPPAGTPVAPPATNSGFEAEQFVAAALAANGWTAHNVSRQQMGYDFLAKRGTTTRYIEVKSSLGFCSPALTSREWQQAKAHGPGYILSIIENFNAIGSNTIFWVPDPSNSCSARPSQTVNYAIARSSWTGATVAISAI